MSANITYQVGQTAYLKGCFTEEFFIRGMTAQQIGQELGLPQRRLTEGMFIAYAVRLPALHEFKLGGWAEFSTDKFIEYRKGKMIWNESDFEKTYDGKRMPISIEAAKKGWRQNMTHIKLIKVLLPIVHDNRDVYPSGGKASQIIITHPIECHVVKFLKPNDLFRGVWS